MQAPVKLLCGHTPNPESHFQATMEIHPWGYFHFWLIFGYAKTPLLDPNFSPPCGQLAAPYLYAHGEPGPNFKSST